MTNKEFYDLMQTVFDSCQKIAKSKGEDYTKGSLDALANFKEGGIDVGIDPMKVCWIFMNKHYQAITNYVKTGGQSESEPINERIKDMINYLVLLQGLITEGSAGCKAISERRLQMYHPDSPAVTGNQF
jgi:hypothetical protein